MVFWRGQIKGGCPCVIDSSAAQATQVIVLGRIGIKAGIAAGVFEFLDQSHPSQQVKVAVNRAQTHLRQSPPDEVMEFNRRRMGSDSPQFLENDLPLPRLAAMACLEPARRVAGCRRLIISRGDDVTALWSFTIHNENYY